MTWLRLSDPTFAWPLEAARIWLIVFGALPVGGSSGSQWVTEEVCTMRLSTAFAKPTIPDSRVDPALLLGDGGRSRQGITAILDGCDA
jgi:hypothetical protein